LATNIGTSILLAAVGTAHGYFGRKAVGRAEPAFQPDEIFASVELAPLRGVGCGMRLVWLACLLLLLNGCSGDVDSMGADEPGVGSQGLPRSWTGYWALDAEDPDTAFLDPDADGVMNLEEFVDDGLPRPWLHELLSSFPRALPSRVEVETARSTACVVQRSADGFTGLGLIRVDRQDDLERIARWMKWQPDRTLDRCQEIEWPDVALDLNTGSPRAIQARMHRGGHPQYEIVTRYTPGGQPLERVHLSTYQRDDVLIVYKSVDRWRYDDDGRITEHSSESRAEAQISDAAARALQRAGTEEDGYVSYPSDLPEELRELAELGAEHFPTGGPWIVPLSRTTVRYERDGGRMASIHWESTDPDFGGTSTRAGRIELVYGSEAQVIAIERYATYWAGPDEGWVEHPLRRIDRTWCSASDAWLTEIERDPAGRIAVVTGYDHDGRVCSSVSFDYDPEGRLVARRPTWPDGETDTRFADRTTDPIPGPGEFAGWMFAGAAAHGTE